MRRVADPQFLAVSQPKTKAELRRLRKKARVMRTTDGGYLSLQKFAAHLQDTHADLTATGEVQFRAPLPRLIIRPLDDGLRYQWGAGISGGFAVMKTDAGLACL